MRTKPDSRQDHWFPKVLRKYWANGDNLVSAIDPGGNIKLRVPHNDRAGATPFGHTYLRKTFMECNFEPLFNDNDDRIRRVIKSLNRIDPTKAPLTFAARMLRLALRRKAARGLADLCCYHLLDEALAQRLMLLILSLLVRSPAYQHMHGVASPASYGFPENKDVGKINIRLAYENALSLLRSSSADNVFFVIIYSPFQEFVFGDGFPDTMSSSLAHRVIAGRALVPLTPNICVYASHQLATRTDRNCATYVAQPWQVDRVNELMQIYSGHRLFFRNEQPILTEHFTRGQFLQHDMSSDEFIRSLDAIGASGTIEYLFRSTG